MDFVADYGSEEEEETHVVQTKVVKVKKRKLDINILPPEIQKALTQSDSILDSDDDADTKLNIDIQNPNSVKSVSGLLGMLPKPKSSESYQKSTTILENRPVKSIQNIESSILVSEVSRIESQADSNNDGGKVKYDFEDEDDTNNDDVEDHEPFPSNPLFSFESKKKTSVAHSKLLLPSVNMYSRPSTGRSSPTPLSTSVYATSNMSQSIPTFKSSITTVSSSSSLSSSSAINNPYNHSYAVNTSSPSYSNTNTPQNTIENPDKHARRKRDREIEIALQNGNIDVILNPQTTTTTNNNDIDGGGSTSIIPNNAHIIDIQGIGKWDESHYQSQKEKEYDVMKSYNLTNGTINQPTKQQNRKHQINSLAFQAAKAELALLESKGSRMKTKYETQAKYGW